METSSQPISDGDSDTAESLAEKRIALVGKLGGMNRAQAKRLLRDHGAVPQESIDDTTNFVVIGADELPLDEESVLDEQVRSLAAKGSLSVISETQLWEMLGLVDDEHNIRRLYTPAMLAELLGVSVAIIRRWHRRGLIVPAREVHKLPYFDFQEVSSAKRLGELLAAGASPHAVEKKLEELSRWLPSVERPLAQLSVIVEGRQLLLRQGEGLIEPGGQLRLDFYSSEGDNDGEEPDDEPATISIEDTLTRQPAIDTPDDMVRHAGELEDDGQLPDAADMYRAALVAGGPSADVCFRLAEVLYMLNDVTGARERYSMAIELDEDFVEARANLGCVLVELSEPQLAIAAFEGALALHPDYPDVHFHLARTLDDVKESDRALGHWRRFLELAPDSPWASEAITRLEYNTFPR